MGKALGVLMLGASLSAAVYGWMSLEEAMDQGPATSLAAASTEAAQVPEPRVISSSRSSACAPWSTMLLILLASRLPTTKTWAKTWARPRKALGMSGT